MKLPRRVSQYILSALSTLCMLSYRPLKGLIGIVPTHCHLPPHPSAPADHRRVRAHSKGLLPGIAAWEGLVRGGDLEIIADRGGKIPEESSEPSAILQMLS